MKKAIIYIYDQVGDYGISANDFAVTLQELEDQGADEFEVHINSPGGNVYDGIAIYNLLKERKCDVYIDGIAASIASVIAMAGDKIFIYPNALFMIHNPWTFTGGDERELEKNKKILQLLKESIIKAYTEKTGLSEDELKDLMDEETWFNADSALEKGFADEIVVAKEKDFIAIYAKFEGIKKQKPRRRKKMNKQFLMFLGFTEAEITANPTEAQVTAKLESVKSELGLDENATIQSVMDKIAESADPPAEPENNTDLEKMQARIDALENTGTSDKAEALVNQAISDFKIMPADKDVYLASAQNDLAGTKKILDAKAKNSVKPGKVEVKTDNTAVTPQDKLTAASDFFKAQGRAPVVAAKE